MGAKRTFHIPADLTRISEAARLTDRPYKQIYHLVRDGKVRGYKIATHKQLILVKMDEVENALRPQPFEVPKRQTA